MGSVRWIGGAEEVAQVDHITPANVESTDIFNVHLGSTNTQKTISFTATASTVPNVTAGITAAVNTNANRIPEFYEVEATDMTTYVKIVGRTKGKPYTLTSTESDGTGTDTQTFVTVNQTAATGPNHWNDVDNWDTGSIPVDADDIYVDSGNTNILHALDQNGVSPRSLTVGMQYTGKIGLAEVNKDRGSSSYPEYRDKYLKLSNSGDSTTMTITIGGTLGPGSSRIRLDCNTGRTVVNVLGTGRREESGFPAFTWKGTHALNEINVSRGDMGIGFVGGEDSDVSILRVGYIDSIIGDSSVFVGASITTLTTIEQVGGSLDVASDASAALTITLHSQINGESVFRGDVAITTATIDGGTMSYLSRGTIATLNIGGGASALFDKDLRTKTVTACNIYAGSTLIDAFGNVTWGAGPVLVRCSIPDVILDLGPNKTITPT